MANVHPWFADVTVQEGASWTYEFFQQNDVALAQNLTNKPNMYIAETGWPTVSCFNKSPPFPPPFFLFSGRTILTFYLFI